MSDTGKIDSLDTKSQATEKLKQRLEEMGVMPSEGRAVSKPRSSGIGFWNGVLILALIAVVGYVLVGDNVDNGGIEPVVTDNMANLEPIGSVVTEELKTDAAATDDSASTQNNTLFVTSNSETTGFASSSDPLLVELDTAKVATDTTELKIPVDDPQHAEVNLETTVVDHTRPMEPSPMQNNLDAKASISTESLVSTDKSESATSLKKASQTPVGVIPQTQDADQPMVNGPSGRQLATQTIPPQNYFGQPTRRWAQHPHNQLRHPQMSQKPMMRGQGYPPRYWHQQMRPGMVLPNPPGKMLTPANPVNPRHQWGAGYYPQPGPYYPVYPYTPRRW